MLGVPMDATDSARAFIQSFTARTQPLSRTAALAQWELATHASPEAEKRAADAQIELCSLYADEATYREAQRLDGCDIGDPIVRREVRLLYLTTLTYRRDPQTLEQIVRLETELETAYSTYRGQIAGENSNENQIREILRTEVDSDRRRQAYEASKGIGPLVAPLVLKLAGLRNQVARSLGFRDWFAMALFTDELDEAWLFELLADLDRSTAGPFTAEKAAIDAEASAWLGVAPGELMPWHYQDVFFQEAPTTAASSIEPLLQGKDVIAIARELYRDLGFEDDVAEILSRSDLFARDNKSQHAFCTDIDRAGDVRVLCNVTPSERWLDTMLHELGHGIYDLGIDPALPWGLRAPAHIFVTEAIAMLMGRRTRDPELFARYIRARTAEEQAIDRTLLRRRMLMLVRWVMVMTHFERELYAEPARDAAALGRIWWDLVERFQHIRRPPGERPTDWSTKIHVALAPVYYQNYLLGELGASQIEAAIMEQTGRPLTGNRAGGELLRERCFRPGASLRWDALIERTTGKALSPSAFAADFVNSYK